MAKRNNVFYLIFAVFAVVAFFGCKSSDDDPLPVTPQAATPTFSPGAGSYTSVQSVTISTATAGATIRYTIDGTTTPSSSTGTVYTGAIAVSETTTVRALAYKPGITDSGVAEAVYTLEVVTPTFSPGAGAYTSDQSVTISTTTAGATIRYTIDGTTTPTSSTGTVYTGAVTVSSTTILRAIAFKTGWVDSDVAEAVYTLEVVTPTLSPGAGAYTGDQSVTISTTTAGASIRYTIDGTTPTSTTGTVYTGAVTVSSSITLRAIAFKTGWADSDVAGAAYDITQLKDFLALGWGVPAGSVLIYSTDDGSTWTTGDAGVSYMTPVDEITTAGNGNWINITGGDGVQISTDDAETWTDGSLATTYHFNLAAAGDGSRWVIVGASDADDAIMIQTSTDGGANFNFATVPAVNERLYDVATDFNGNWVAVGGTGTVVSSADGTTWLLGNSGVSDGLNNMATDCNGNWVAVGDGGTVLYSTNNGTTWTQGTSGVGVTLSGVATDCSGTWVASGAGGEVIYSTDDGANWTQATSNTAEDLNDVAANGTAWVAVGDNGTVIRSTDAITWSALTPVVTQDLVAVGAKRP